METKILLKLFEYVFINITNTIKNNSNKQYSIATLFYYSTIWFFKFAIWYKSIRWIGK